MRELNVRDAFFLRQRIAFLSVWRSESGTENSSKRRKFHHNFGEGNKVFLPFIFVFREKKKQKQKKMTSTFYVKRTQKE